MTLRVSTELSPATHVFVPKSVKSATHGKCLPSTHVSTILSDHLVSFDVENSHFSPDRFDNLQDKDIFEEGEKRMNVNIFPWQQCNNKKKHERKTSLDGNMTMNLFQVTFQYDWQNRIIRQYQQLQQDPINTRKCDELSRAIDD
ncbi:hypothetical protein H5410_026092 [Solanum commersonii]|uniref:Uncharacterized protein n=1 Tax=Solanum commersonii TaxID=4109 RepID=A0A9J5YXR0_SOLCO|nr:hypothetical protein H5410_026092 [Solanum commersonii]